MKTIRPKEIVEILGVSAIVASLVFVGLQLKQAQDIAIATQYHERAALAIEIFSAQLESGDLRRWGRMTNQSSATEQIEDDLGRTYLTGLSYLTLADNHYYQYQSGFLDDESWRTQRRSLKRNLAHPASAARFALGIGTTAFRDSFADLCDEIVAEIESESR